MKESVWKKCTALMLAMCMMLSFAFTVSATGDAGTPMNSAVSSGNNKADFVFIIDSTGSMSSYIDSVKRNLTSFVQYLTEKDIDLRMSVIDYKDIIEDGADSTKVHEIDGNKWTNSVEKILNIFEDISVDGGGDDPETPTDALATIVDTEWGWRENAKRFAFLLTDATYKDSDSNPAIFNMDEAIGCLRNQNVKVSVVSQLSFKTDYNNLFNLTGGIFADITLDDYYKLMCELAEWVLFSVTDTDGDGLPDDWEINGVDTDGDGVIDLHLEQMGADPNKKDIFVEVDWMSKPATEKKFLWWTSISQEESYAPNESALKKVYEQFKSHDINIHIDAGPDSTDFVTGKKWGELSGGNSIPYSKDFELGSYYQNWNKTVADNFDQSRWKVFRHALFVDRYNGGTSTGIAENAPGQFFIVASVKGLGDTAVAGTFMHELGHTLGLLHGGNEKTNNKPNYLSIMNYSFQLSGLLGTNSTNYSEYELPALNENDLNEVSGIDPEGLTAGTGIGTKWYYYNWNLLLLLSGSKEKEGYAISKQQLDFNNNGKLEDHIKDDLNGDGEYTELKKSINDWKMLTFEGGLIGGKGADLPDPTQLITKDESTEPMEELTVDQAIEEGWIGNPNACTIESVTPQRVFAKQSNQKLYVKIDNLYKEESQVTLEIESELLDNKFSSEVAIEGSDNQISSTMVEIPISSELKAGEYEVSCKLINTDNEDVLFDTIINVTEPQSITMTTGETIDLIGDFTSIDELTKDSFTWSSSNPSVVDVDDGVITALSSGNAVITLSMPDNETMVWMVEVKDALESSVPSDSPESSSSETSSASSLDSSSVLDLSGESNDNVSTPLITTPTTGDSMMLLMLLIGLSALSLGAVVFFVFYKKKN